MTDAGRLELVGGHRAVDLVNTLADTVEEPVEMLRTYHDLLGWGVHASLLTDTDADRLGTLARAHPAEAASALADAIRLRTQLDDVLRARLTGEQPPPRALAGIGDTYVRALGQAELRVDGHRHEWSWSAPEELPDLLWPLSHDVVELLRCGPLDRLRVCTDCRWLFLDFSRNHSRRWCSMSGCGARAKMRRYRASRSR